jgi:hypothetical protein
VYIADATDTWLHNLVTKGVIEMVTPKGEEPTLAANNVNGFMSSILAWIREGTIGSSKFPGFLLHYPEELANLDLTPTCKTALSQRILCTNDLIEFQTPMVGKKYDVVTLYELACDEECGESLRRWYEDVSANCGDQRIGRAVPTLWGGYIWAGYNLTCLIDPETEAHCPSLMATFETVPNAQSMPTEELCSYCFTNSLQMRQASPYGLYTEQDQRDLQLVHETCGLTGPTDLHPPLFLDPPASPAICSSGITHTIASGETCDSIALQYGVASATIHSTNADLIYSCAELIEDREICIPLGCDRTYVIQDGDSCYSIDVVQQVTVGTVQEYNLWIDTYCMNLHHVREVLGSVICLTPQGGTHNSTSDETSSGSSGSGAGNKQGGGYGTHVVWPPEGTILAEGTTKWCMRFHTAAEGDRCSVIMIQNAIPASLLLEVNPSLSRTDCDASLVEGLTYCVAPHIHWDDPDLERDVSQSSIGPEYEWYDPLGFDVAERESENGGDE